MCGVSLTRWRRPIVGRVTVVLFAGSMIMFFACTSFSVICAPSSSSFGPSFWPARLCHLWWRRSPWLALRRHVFVACFRRPQWFWLPSLPRLLQQWLPPCLHHRQWGLLLKGAPLPPCSAAIASRRRTPSSSARSVLSVARGAAPWGALVVRVVLLTSRLPSGSST